eukprot:5847374-Pleurochrysis_carterae.AAC.1
MVSASREATRRALPDGRHPPSNFTTGPRARSAVSTASANSRTSVRTAPCSLSSPTTSSMRARTADRSCWRAA